jgi:hypothetical protein
MKHYRLLQCLFPCMVFFPFVVFFMIFSKIIFIDFSFFNIKLIENLAL